MTGCKVGKEVKGMTGCMTSRAWVSAHLTHVDYRVHKYFSTKTDISYNEMFFRAAHGGFFLFDDLGSVPLAGVSCRARCLCKFVVVGISDLGSEKVFGFLLRSSCLPLK